MLIRELTDKDIPSFIEIIKQLSSQASIGILSDMSAWYDLCRLQNKRVFVAEIDGKVVGTVSVLMEDKINRGTSAITGRLRCAAHIEEVVVDSDYRCQNIGRKLMEHAVNYAKLAEAYKIVLTTNEESNGEFYIKCGFYPHEREFRVDLESQG